MAAPADLRNLRRFSIDGLGIFRLTEVLMENSYPNCDHHSKTFILVGEEFVKNLFEHD
jgi:hypothetical protein